MAMSDSKVSRIVDKVLGFLLIVFFVRGRAFLFDLFA